MIRVHLDRPKGAGPAAGPSVHGQRVRLGCRRGRYSVNEDNALVAELGSDQALAVDLVQVGVRTAATADTIS